MTIRKQWLIVLTLTAVIAVSINSFLLSSLINRYFVTYTTEDYNMHVTQIEELARNALIENNFSPRQLSIQFESHLDDPILSIKLYDTQSKLIAIAENGFQGRHDMMNHNMKGMMKPVPEEVDSIEIFDSGIAIGTLNITRYCSINDSVVSSMFRFALVRNSLISFAIVLFVLISIGVFVSKKMSKDLTNTASLALSIDLGDKTNLKMSKIKEIKIIQESLKALNMKLKIKQIGRKRLVDELVHQVRTPLTIIKAHLEGLQDGLIKMTPEEIDVCSEQVENITSIVANMSMMLDANIAQDSVTLENVDINLMLKQIIDGLKVQFNKKQIGLQLMTQQKIFIKTDKYKLSQSIYNIVTNAYKFTPPHGKVEISYKETGDLLTISIQDNGLGICEIDKENLFDAYYKGSNSEQIAGEGLGLFVVKENLSKINGAISVTSEVGKGSRFEISIKCRDALI